MNTIHLPTPTLDELYKAFYCVRRSPLEPLIEGIAEVSAKLENLKDVNELLTTLRDPEANMPIQQQLIHAMAMAFFIGAMWIKMTGWGIEEVDLAEKEQKN